MWVMLRRHLGLVRVRENLVFCLKVAAGSIAAAFIAWVVADNIAPTGDVLGKMDKIKLLLSVAFAGCSGLVIYLGLGALAGVQEVRSVIDFLGKVRGRFSRA